MALLLLGVGLSTPVPVPDSGGGSILSPNQSLRRKEAHKVQVRCNPGAYTSINPVGKSGENMTRWCEANCLVGFCPSDMCKCSDDSATLLPVNESAVAAPRTWRNGGWIDSDSQAEDASEEALAEWERREASEEALADWSKRKERKNEKAMKKSSGGNGADANGPYHGADGEYRGGADAESSIVCQALSQTVTDHWCRTTCTTRWGKLGSCPKKYCKCTDEGGAQSLTPSPVPMSRESARSGVDRWQGSTDQQQEEGRKAVTAHKEAQQAAAAAVKAEQEKSARATKDAEDALDKAKREALQQGSVADDEWEKQEGEQEEEQQEEQQEEQEDDAAQQGQAEQAEAEQAEDEDPAEQADGDMEHELLHAGENCYNACGMHGGYCDWCGERPAACCHGSGSYSQDGPECANVTHSETMANGTLRHACVLGRRQDELATPEIPQFSQPAGPGEEFKALDKTGLELCQRRWKNAMKQMEEKTEDPSDIYRGDQCLKPTKPLLLFVHVGKTCGSSVMQALRNPQNQAAMRRLAPGREPFDAVHMHPVRREVTDSMSRVLITLRDPVDRFISSYNTAACIGDPRNDPSRCRRKENGDESLSASHVKPGTPLTNKITSECFSNVSDFALHLDAQTECGRLARDVIGPNFIEDLGHVGHIGKGACYYLGGVLERLKGKDVYVIDTETCDAGIRGIPTWLGLNSTAFVMPPKVHVGHYPHHDDTVDDEGRARLRKYLAHEYALHEKLRRWTWNRANQMTRLDLERAPQETGRYHPDAIPPSDPVPPSVLPAQRSEPLVPPSVIWR